MSALTSYVVMPFIALFGLNALALRLPFLLAGVASIYLFSLLVAEMQGRRAGRSRRGSWRFALGISLFLAGDTSRIFFRSCC